MLCLMFLLFPKGLDNTAVMKLPEKFLQLRVVFIFIHGQHCKHERAFSLGVTLGPGLPRHTTLGCLIHMLFYVVSPRTPFPLNRVKMAPSGVVLRRALPGTPAPLYTSYPTSYHRTQSHVSQPLSLQALYPRDTDLQGG